MTKDSEFLPFDDVTEMAVLGSILIEPRAFWEAARHLKGTDFFLVRHQYIWDAIARLNEREDALDEITVADELQSMGKLEEIGGRAYLLHLVNTTPSSVYASVYAQLIKRMAVRRLLLVCADQIKNIALDGDLALEKVAEQSQTQLDSVIEYAFDRQQHTQGQDSQQFYAELLAGRVERFQRGERIGYPMPEKWDGLQQLIPVIFPGDFIVVDGPSGSGKSAFLETWAEHFAREGAKTEYIHTEMTREDILDRRMARHSGVPFDRLASGNVSDAQQQRVDAANLDMESWTPNLSYNYLPDVRVKHLYNHLRRRAMQGVQVFFLDHFQDVSLDDNDNVVRALEMVVTWLNAFAEKRQVVLIVASQQNDKGDTKWSKKLVEKAKTRISLRRPILSNEQMYVYNGIEVRCMPGELGAVAEVKVRKARFGKTGKRPFLYHGPGFVWTDVRYSTRVSVAKNVVPFESAKAAAAPEEASEQPTDQQLALGENK